MVYGKHKINHGLKMNMTDASHDLKRILKSNSTNSNDDSKWVEVRNSSGHLLFLYNPYDNTIELKRGGIVYDIVKLDEIREKYLK